MGKFEEARKKIQEGNKSQKRTHNERYFNELCTALLNDPDYECKKMVVEKGEIVEKASKPVADFRKVVIGGVAKAAGADQSEQAKLVDEYQLPLVPMADIVSETMYAYLMDGRKFQFNNKHDFQASLEINKKDTVVKEVSAPGSTDVKKQKQEEHYELKAKSNCPSNLKTYLD